MYPLRPRQPGDRPLPSRDADPEFLGACRRRAAAFDRSSPWSVIGGSSDSGAADRAIGSSDAATVSESPPMTAAAPGADWQVGSVLAITGLSVVRLAWGPGEPRERVPAYVLKQAATGPASRRARLAIAQEVDALSTVGSRHVVPLLDARLNGGEPFLVLPRLVTARPAGVARRPIEREQLGRVADVALQVCRGLRDLHAAGWIHGDPSPDHVAVDASLHVTLFDLGLARRIDGAGGESRASRRVEIADRWQGAVTGSLSTLAPEAFRPGTPIGPERDWYAFGLILHAWLTGRSPWEARTEREWERAHRTQAADLTEIRRAGFPAGLVDLLGRLLAKDPLRRPEGSEIESRLLELAIDRFGGWIAPAA